MMERGRTIEAMNGEFPLPEAIVQRIQSFLSGKQAARTSILSKSWYSAWLTRLNLDLNEPDFRVVNEFWEFAGKTMQRYVELNLKFETFRLCTRSDLSRNATELIVKALKMGVNDLSVEHYDPTFVLPHEVLESENLIKLSVSGGTIDRWADGKVSCTRLKSLSLRSVCIGNGIAWDIISSCPLIEKLLLSECKCFLGVKPRLSKTWTWGPSTESVKQRIGSVALCPIKVFDFHKLNCLLLEKANLGVSFFRDFTIKFPCLEDLTIRECHGYGSMRISSLSLKYISIEQKWPLRATFDVPSIHKFSVSVPSIPSVSFGMGMALREWESSVSIKWHQHRVSAKWFIMLKRFLTTLSMSKISISIEFVLAFCFGCVGKKKIERLPKPVVENLVVSLTSSSGGPTLLDSLFWCCRPKVITLYWLSKQSAVDDAFLERLCKRLIQEVSQNCHTPNPSISCLRNLKEANVEVFEESLAEWWPLRWETLLDPSTHLTNTQKVRFRLKWDPPDHSGGS